MRSLKKVTKASIKNTLFESGMVRIKVKEFLNTLKKELEEGYWVEDEIGQLWVDERSVVCDLSAGYVFDFAIRTSFEAKQVQDEDNGMVSVGQCS